MNEFFGDLILIIFFSQKKGFPSNELFTMLFNFAPRKFKNLGTDAFIASRIIKFFLIISRCICNKGVRSRQEYKKCHQLLTFGFDANGSEILESHFRNIFNVHSM